jgi:hypothetical protein
MTMAKMDPARAAEKLRQRIVANSIKGPQVVFISLRGVVDCCTLDSARHHALASRPDFFNRVAGVFDASATMPLLAASLSELAQ